MNDASPYDLPDTLPPGAAAPFGRPSWSGLLQFSLVGIPLKAYPAVHTRDVPSGHLLHADCGQRLRYAKHCPIHGAVDSAAIVHGYEYGPGRHVVVAAEELDQLRPAQDKALRLERFLAPRQLDPVLFGGRSLYLVPDGPAAEPGYAVLHAVLVQRQHWALGRMVLGGHRQIVVVRPAGAALALQVLHYPEQVRSSPLVAVRLPDKADEEMRLAGLLIDAAAGTIDWSAYRDQAAQELKALIEAKLAGQPVATLEPERAILPLLEALQQSVAAQNGHVATPAAKARAPRKRGRRTA
jgi:DNA end-binding protein Ku